MMRKSLAVSDKNAMRPMQAGKGRIKILLQIPDPYGVVKLKLILCSKIFSDLLIAND